MVLTAKVASTTLIQSYSCNVRLPLLLHSAFFYLKLAEVKGRSKVALTTLIQSYSCNVRLPLLLHPAFFHLKLAEVKGRFLQQPTELGPVNDHDNANVWC
jgi:hypothetical protein